MHVNEICSLKRYFSAFSLYVHSSTPNGLQYNLKKKDFKLFPASFFTIAIHLILSYFGRYHGILFSRIGENVVKHFIFAKKYENFSWMWIQAATCAFQCNNNLSNHSFICFYEIIQLIQ